jgi:parallel beta-helix repeat protein
MSGNSYNFAIFGTSLSHYTQSIDTSNTVDGKPIYYWVNWQNQQVPNDARFVGVVNSTNITVKDSTLTKNWSGVLFAYTDNSRIENVTTENNYYGTYLSSSSNNNMLTSNNASNNDGGIYLDSSSNNNTLINNNATNNREGIYLGFSSNSTLINNTANLNNDFGIWLESSNNNNITSSTALNNTDYDFYSDADSRDNTIEDLTIASYPTTISFTYDNGVGIKGVETPPSDPTAKVNIGKYVNATSVTASSWLFLNVSYTDADLGSVDEDSLTMWRHDGTNWAEVPAPNGVNTAENYVYANITSFSIFAPLGSPAAPPEAPIAEFSATPTRGVVPLTVQFTDESTKGTNPAYTYQWDFGDGGTSTEANPSYTYRAPGKYTVSLTITDNVQYSNTETKARYITVVAPTEVVEPASFAPANLHVSPQQVQPKQQVKISINIGNNGGQTGTYTAVLIIDGPDGRTTESQTIGVSPGSCQNVAFTVTKATPGTYHVSLAGLGGQFTVVGGGVFSIGGLGTWGIVAIAIIAIVLILGLVFILRRE